MNDAEKKLRDLIKENKILKEKVKCEKEEDDMKKKEDMGADTQAGIKGRPEDSASSQPDGSTQDDMKKKYEEGDTQAGAKAIPEASAKAKPEGASQDDMKQKYSEDMGKDTQTPPDPAIEDSATEKPAGASQDIMPDKYPKKAATMEGEGTEEKPEVKPEEEIKEGEGKNDMDKIVEILEAIKSKIDEHDVKLKELTKGEEKPEAPISEKLKRLTEKFDEKSKPVNLINKL